MMKGYPHLHTSRLLLQDKISYETSSVDMLKLLLNLPLPVVDLLPLQSS